MPQQSNAATKVEHPEKILCISFARRRYGRVARIRARVLPKQATKEQFSKCIR
jgi:hypothetical protein